MLTQIAGPQHAFIGFGNHSRSFSALRQRLTAVFTVTVLALATVSCGTAAQAAGTQSPQQIALHAVLPTGTVNQAYNAVMSVSGGLAPYHFAVKSGTLPAGLMLGSTTGSLSGTPTIPGTYSFQIEATDAPRPDQGVQSFSIVVNGITGGGVTVTVSPANVTLASGGKQQFTASVTGTANTAVTWSATAGTVSSSGLFTAPIVTSATSVTVKAASQADPAKFAIAVATVSPNVQQPLAITTTGLPEAQQGGPYSDFFMASGGTLPYSWALTAGNLPSGLSLKSNGDLSGTPSGLGAYHFTVTVTDKNAKTATGNFLVTVIAGTNFDGPAELPRVQVSSAVADTPASGTVINVGATGNLQTALNNAQCGETIQLQAGATYSGKFIVPAKGCDNNHWIVIRTSSPDSALPAEGQRLTPCYGGVASLQGRPAYSCPNPKNVLAKVQMNVHDDGPFQFANGASFYRFIGLEVTRPVGTPGAAILFSAQGTADHIILDRMWLHGQPQDETHNGISVDGMTYVAVVDSYFNDFKCISNTGQCTDAHAIAGGVTDTQDGPYKIQNNFLEASTEPVMFGGGAASMTPADITIVGNHFWKPWQWMKGNTPFVGGANGNPFVVKNHIELKNAVRVLIEGNILENSWGGFSQTGYGVLLTPKNQHTPSGTNVCPICQVTDVTIRYSRISHGGGGIQMATALSGNGSGGAAAYAGTRWSIHDVVIDDLSTKYVGGGTAFEFLNDWATNPLNTVTINHVTAFPDSGKHVMIIGNLRQNQAMYSLVFTNNLVVTGQYPVWNTGGGSGSCAYQDVPITTITTCFSSYVFANNALIAAPSNFPPSSWPANNLFPASINSVQFMNFNYGNGGNYELQSSSPYKAKGTDGKDLGADIAGLNNALANVE